MLGRQPKLGRAAENRISDLAAFALLDVDRDLRMLAQEGGQRLRQIFRQSRGIGEQADGRLHTAGKGG